MGLGGNYAEPEDPSEARISKIVRGTMTRLHAEVARSISLSPEPVRQRPCSRLSRGGSTVGLPYMVEFFREKLQMPIDLFNSMRNVTVANGEVSDQLAGKAHTLGEAVGCALRSLGMCRWKSTCVRTASCGSRVSPNANPLDPRRKLPNPCARRRVVSTSTGPTPSPRRCSIASTRRWKLGSGGQTVRCSEY